MSAVPFCAAAGSAPRQRRTAEQRDELAPLHSITSSARASSDCRHVDAKCLGGLEIDHQFVLGRRLYRQVGWLLALEDAIDIASGAAVLVDKIRPVGDQAAGRGEVARAVNRRNAVASNHCSDQIALRI